VSTTNPTLTILGLNHGLHGKKPVNKSQTYFIRTIKSALTNCMQVTVNLYFIQWTTVASLFMQLYDLLLSHWHLHISWSDPEFDLCSGCGLCFETNVWPIHAHEHVPMSVILSPMWWICDLLFHVTVQSFQTEASIILENRPWPFACHLVFIISFVNNPTDMLHYPGSYYSIDIQGASVNRAIFFSGSATLWWMQLSQFSCQY
jgi:hypothetical protein